MAAPLQESDLIFPQAARSFHEALGEIKRADLSLLNRLRSIQHDADFVQRVATSYQLPLIANERCGSWYIAPASKADSAYFKSTDGHFGQWAFSLRRLNLHILKVIGVYGGCIIVDSTRRGKSMPDALSKTVPIWIAVLNRLLFPERAETHTAQTPADVVSQSEHSQIQNRLDELVEAAGHLRLDLETLRGNLHHKPMRPQWVTPSGTSASQGEPNVYEGYHEVVLCTASSHDSAAEGKDGYVQGAADDHETWAMGLTPTTFWANMSHLLSASVEDLPFLIQDCTKTKDLQSIPRIPTQILPTQNIFIGDSSVVKGSSNRYDIVISCGIETLHPLPATHKARYIHLRCAQGKVGSRQLRHELAKIEEIRAKISSSSKVLVLDEYGGKDLAVGAALALICLCFTTDGQMAQPVDLNPMVNKTDIKQRLSWIMTAIPDAAPSRATLQSVNAYLMA